jgi:hypothetical protein
MKALALLMLLACGAASAQTPDRQETPKAVEQRPRPLILRIDQLPPSERTVGVEETPVKKPGDGLPDLGGRPSPALGRGAITGSGTEAAGSPFPKDTQQAPAH